MTTVCAGLIERDGQVLVCRRRVDQTHPLKWEFPGGKAEPGEEPVATLRRELKEELGMEVGQATEITRFSFQYPGRDAVLLVFFRVDSYSGSLENRIFAEIKWVERPKLPDLDFLEGDIAFVRLLADGKWRSYAKPAKSTTGQLTFYGASDTGRVRPSNEDAFALEPELGLFALADGMGGAQAGERASTLAIETLIQSLREAAPPHTMETLRAGVQSANSAIRRMAAKDPDLEGMGTTLVAALLDLPHAHIVSVGDSRVYLHRKDTLECITSDQTWVNQVGRGLGLTEEQIKAHPFRHVLTMAVGARGNIEILGYALRLEAKDLLLFSSDGLHGVVPDTETAEILGSEGDLPAKAARLIAAAKARGGPDNITVVLLENTA